MMRAQISAPMPNCGQPPSTVTRWLVFITLPSMHSTSMGRMVRRLITWKTSAVKGPAQNPTGPEPTGGSHLAVDSLLGEDGGGVQAMADEAGVGNQRDVAP